MRTRTFSSRGATTMSPINRRLLNSSKSGTPANGHASLAATS